MKNEFTVVIKKMKEVFTHDKIQNLLKQDINSSNKSHSKTITKKKIINNKIDKNDKDHKIKVPSLKVPSSHISLSKINKEKIDKSNIQEECDLQAKDLLTNFSQKNEVNFIKNNELIQQQLSFKERLEKKKKEKKGKIPGKVNISTNHEDELKKKNKKTSEKAKDKLTELGKTTNVEVQRESIDKDNDIEIIERNYTASLNDGNLAHYNNMTKSCLKQTKKYEVQNRSSKKLSTISFSNKVLISLKNKDKFTDKNKTSKNLLECGIFFDKSSNKIRVSQKKLIQIQTSLNGSVI